MKLVAYNFSSVASRAQHELEVEYIRFMINDPVVNTSQYDEYLNDATGIKVNLAYECLLRAGTINNDDTCTTISGTDYMGQRYNGTRDAMIMTIPEGKEFSVEVCRGFFTRNASWQRSGSHQMAPGILNLLQGALSGLGAACSYATVHSWCLQSGGNQGCVSWNGEPTNLPFQAMLNGINGAAGYFGGGVFSDYFSAHAPEELQYGEQLIQMCLSNGPAGC